MLNVLRVIVNFNNLEEIYEIGINEVKSIIIDEKEGFIKICYEPMSTTRYLIIPIAQLYSYDYL